MNEQNNNNNDNKEVSNVKLYLEEVQEAKTDSKKWKAIKLAIPFVLSILGIVTLLGKYDPVLPLKLGVAEVLVAMIVAINNLIFPLLRRENKGQINEPSNDLEKAKNYIYGEIEKIDDPDVLTELMKHINEMKAEKGDKKL